MLLDEEKKQEMNCIIDSMLTGYKNAINELELISDYNISFWGLLTHDIGDATGLTLTVCEDRIPLIRMEETVTYLEKLKSYINGK